jgi:branched-chain amino acid transport system ATP-binding protein
MTEPALLSASEISVRYGRVDALHGISLAVAAASLTVILGPNGAGKTTLVRALAGAVPVQSGSVSLRGRTITALPAFRRVRAGIALVPEGRGVLRGLTVLDNLELGYRSSAAAKRDTHEAGMEEVFTLFPVLRERLHQDCSTLSGGQMQMLAIARALLAKPDVLLLDEPSLGLAPLAVAHVYEALRILLARGLAIVLVEQKAVPLSSERETTIVLQNGHAVFQAPRRPTADELAALYFGKAVA